MVSEEKMTEEIDKATEALMKSNLIEEYGKLMRIKWADNKEEILDLELKVLEIKMKCLGIEFESLKKSFEETTS